MRRILLMGLLIVWSCKEDDEKQSRGPQPMNITPHNSLGEFYAEAPITMTYSLPPDEQLIQIDWDFGDSNTATAATYIQHSYRLPSDYTITTKSKTNRRSRENDTTISIIKGPKIFGSAETRERSMIMYNNGDGRLNLIYELNSRSSASSYYLLKVGKDLELSIPIALNFGVSPDFGSHAYSVDGKLAITSEGQLHLFSNEGQKIKTYGLNGGNKFARDIKIFGNDVVTVFDSINHVVINTIDLQYNISTETRYNVSVEGMVAHDFFLTSDSTLVAHMKNPVGDITLLMGLDFMGNVLFSNYFESETPVQNVTSLGSGTFNKWFRRRGRGEIDQV